MKKNVLTERFSDTFAEALPVLSNARRGLLVEDGALIRESISKFRKMIRDGSAYAETVARKTDKNEEETKYVEMLIPLQIAAQAIENVMEKMALKVEAKIPFTNKALKEIGSLQFLLYDQLKSAKDYVTTGDPRMKEEIRKGMEEMKRLAAEYELVHQERLITGICMPKASYLYIDITDSLKRAARALVEFSEKL